MSHFRLARLPVSARLVVTCFVALMGFGYLASLGHLFFTYSAADGKPGVSPEDLRLHIVGKPDKTLLETKLLGSMGQYLPNVAEKNKVLTWIHNGATEAQFASVQPILAKNCVTCHTPGGASGFRPLRSFQEVAAVTQTDRGESPQAWARVAHVHLQSLGMVYLLLGLVFAFCGVPEKLKLLVGPAPFIALVADFGARATAHSMPAMVYVVMASGAVAGMATGVMILAAFWECWIVNWWSGRKPIPTATLTPAPEPAG